MKMRNLGQVIRAFIARYKTDPFKLSELSGIEIAKINAWESSRDVSITPKEILRLARAFCPKGKDYREAHAYLLMGFLQDQCVGPGGDLIAIEKLPRQPWLLITSFGTIHVNMSIMKYLQVIHKNLHNKEVRARIRSIVDYCKKEGLYGVEDL